MQCNRIREDRDNSVEILDPTKMMGKAENPDVEPLAQEAQAELLSVTHKSD